MATHPTSRAAKSKAQPDSKALEKAIAVARRKARLSDLIAKEGSGGAASLARKAGRSQGGINHMATKGYDFGVRAARSLEQALGLPQGYFDAVEPSSSKTGGVPLQDWSQIGQAAASDGETVISPWVVGPRAVAAKAKPTMWGGDSCQGIPPDWICIIDPDAEANEGDIVCVRPTGAPEAGLWRFERNAGSDLLYPLDRRLEIVHWTETGFACVGPVIGALKYFRD